MKIILLMLSLTSFFAYADVTDKMEIFSFLSLTVKGEKLNGNSILTSGYLAKHDDGFQLCTSEAICLSKGFDKILVPHKSIKGGKNNDMVDYVGCYIRLAGTFHSGSFTNSPYLGELTDSWVFELSVNLSDPASEKYNSCEVWKLYKESKASE